MMHGTLTGYTNKGCRCADCKAAGKQWRENRRPKRVQRRLPVEPIIAMLDDSNRRDFMHGLKRFVDVGIPIFSADHWCCKLGYHPWMVYGDVWFEDIWEKEKG